MCSVGLAVEDELWVISLRSTAAINHTALVVVDRDHHTFRFAFLVTTWLHWREKGHVRTFYDILGVPAPLFYDILGVPAPLFINILLLFRFRHHIIADLALARKKLYWLLLLGRVKKVGV